MQLKILEIVSTFPPYKGGTGNVCFHNATQLAINGHEVVVLTPKQESIRQTRDIDGIKIIEKKPFIRIGNSALTPSMIKNISSEFDVIHLHGPYLGDGLITSIGSLLKNIPLAYTYHNDIILPSIADFIPRMDSLMIQRIIIRTSRRTIFTSQDYADNCRIASYTAKNTKKIDILPNGVNTKEFTPEKKATSRTILENEKVKKILFVGALDKAHVFKGIPVLLRAIRALERQPVILIIVGSGDMISVYKRLAIDLQIQKRVIFLDQIGNKELPTIYSNVDMLVLPSTTLGEAFGMVLLEAMASGKPVIASDLPGVRTVVKENDAGVLCRPGDHEDLVRGMNYLLSNEDIAEEFGRNGRRACEEKYDWKKIGNKLEKILLSISMS